MPPLTTGTSKSILAKQLTAATTEDGSVYCNVDTSGAGFTTTLAAALIVGEQLRFKQANGSWATNAWSLTSSLANGLKGLSSAGVVGAGVTSINFTSKDIGEVVVEWDGAAWQVTQLQAVLGGVEVEQAMTIATQDTIPALTTAWNGAGDPSLVINGVDYFNGNGVTFTANSTAVTVTPATLGMNVNVGDVVVAVYNI